MTTAYNYEQDEYGKICLRFAKQCRTEVGFGATFVDRNGYLAGVGRNRLATNFDRRMIPHTDYAIHAEQSAILDAILKGYDIIGGQVFVLGLCLTGKAKGKLTTRTERIFVCRKCPHVLTKYDISVNIPYITGWMNIPAKEAMEIGTRVADKGYWKDFIKA
jgi:hypothetical protein